MTRRLRPLGTLAFVAAWLTPWRPAYRTRTARSNLTFYAHHRDLVGRHLGKYGTYEPSITQWIAKHLDTTAPGIVVDIGANIGWHTLHAAKHPGVQSVVAFEPDPFNAWLLDRNLVANKIDNVVVDARAVGSEPGLARIYRYKSSNFGRHTLVHDHGFGSRLVPVTDLDGALDAHGLADRPISIMKIDVEGYEPAVITGASRALTRVNALILEYSPKLSERRALSAMVQTLSANGLSPFALSNDGSPISLSLADVNAIEDQTDLLWLRKTSPT